MAKSITINKKSINPKGKKYIESIQDNSLFSLPKAQVGGYVDEYGRFIPYATNDLPNYGSTILNNTLGVQSQPPAGWTTPMIWNPAWNSSVTPTSNPYNGNSLTSNTLPSQAAANPAVTAQASATPASYNEVQQPQVGSTNIYNPIDQNDIRITTDILKTQGNIAYGMQTSMNNIDNNLIFDSGTVPNVNTQQHSTLGFANVNPYYTPDMNSALFSLGQSLNFDSGAYDNPAMGGVAKGANLLRGISAGAKILLSGARQVASGAAWQNAYQQAMQSYNQRVRENLTGNYTYMENGGKMTPAKAATTDYISGLPNAYSQNANTEVEGGEYYVTAGGETQKIIGNSHEQGGELMHLNPGDKVVSDNLKIGGSNAQYYRKEFLLDVKADNTFADVADKFTKKLGLQNIIDSKEKWNKKVEDNMKTQDENTRNVNQEYLSSKLIELEQEGAPLEQARDIFMQDLFDRQEKLKSDKGIVTDESEMKFGGLFKDEKFAKLCELNGITIEEGKNIVMKNGGKVKCSPKKMEDGGVNSKYYSFVLNNLEIPQGYLGQQDNNIFDDSYILSGNVSNSNVNDYITYNITLHPQLAQYVEKNPDSGLLQFKAGDSVKKFQQQVQNNYTNALDYARKNIKDPAELKAFENRIQELSFNDESARTMDNKFGNFTASRSAVAFPLVSEAELARLREQGIYTYSQLLNEEGQLRDDLALSEQTMGLLGDINTSYGSNFDVHLMPYSSTTSTPAATSTIADTSQKTVTEQTPISNNLNTRQGKVNAPVFLPDQSITTPDGIVPTTMLDTRYSRIDPIIYSNEPYLQNLYEQQASIVGSLDGLSDGQRGAVIAGIQANTARAINEATSRVAQQNAIAQQQADMYNANVNDREVDARNANLKRYEAESLTALDKTQQDLRNYFERNREIRLRSANDYQRINAINQIFSNYGIDPYGAGVSFTGGNATWNPSNLSAITGNSSQLPNVSAQDLANMSSDDFNKKYNMTKTEYRGAVSTLLRSTQR